MKNSCTAQKNFAVAERLWYDRRGDAMTLSFAPMEGVTGQVFRRVHHDFFPQADKYYAPFIEPDRKGEFKISRLRDILPENNDTITLVPQVLANDAEAFLHVARQLADMGYAEVNLNIGCPSATVVSKHKGAAMLREPEHAASDQCLYIGSINDVEGQDFLWNLGGSTPAELLEAKTPVWQGLLDAFNGK